MNVYIAGYARTPGIKFTEPLAGERAVGLGALAVPAALEHPEDFSGGH